MTAPDNAPDPQSPWAAPPVGGPMAPPPFPQPGHPMGQPQNGLGVAALVVGLVGALSGIVPFLFWLAGVLGVLALIFGLTGHAKARKGEATNKGVALAGAILGGVAVVLAIVWAVVLVLAVNDFADKVRDEVDKSRSADPAPGTGSGDDAADEEADAVPEPGIDTPLAFGDSYTYDDGVQVTVTEPKAYRPDEFAAGHKQGNVAIQLSVTIVNGGKKTLDVTTALPTLRDAKGADVELIFDGSDATRPFNGKVLTGKRVTADFAFSVPADAAKEVQLQVGPEVLTYDDVLWAGPAR